MRSATSSTNRLNFRASRPLVALAAATALAALAACSPGADGDSGSGAEEQTLVVGAVEEPPTLDVQQSDSNGLTLAAWSINEALIDFDETGQLVPVLAAEIPTVDPDDENVWTISLREGIEFTDGTPLDAEAVKYNIDRIIDPNYVSDLAGNFATVQAANVIDTHTVEVVTSTPDAILDRKLRVLRLVSPAAAEAETLAEQPVGTGPYTIGEWKKGVSLTLEANQDYWGEPKPTIDTVEIRFIPDPNTRLSALQSGEIDLDVAPPIDRVNQLVEGDDFKALETAGGSSGITFLPGVMTPYSDVNFRKALNYAIDRDAIVENIFAGRFVPQTGNLMAEGTEGYVPELEGTYTYDPEKARQLLAEVDVPDDFVVELVTSGIYEYPREVSGAIAANWQDIGLDVDVRIVEAGEYLRLLFEDPGTVVLFGTSSNETGTIMRQVDAYYREGAAGNVIDPDSQERLTPLIDAATTAFDADVRQGAISDLATAISEQALPLFVYHSVDVALADAGVQYDAGFGGFQRISFNFVTMSE